jgi:hypothetical protein
MIELSYPEDSMDFIIETLRDIDAMTTGITLAAIGVALWYTPRSGYWRAIEQGNLRNTQNWRSYSHDEAANKVEAMYANSRRWLPMY